MQRLIHNVRIFTNTEAGVLEKHAVLIDGPRIAAVATEQELRVRYPQAQPLDGGGRLLLPGLVNVHMHFYSTFARGLALPKSPKNFAEILQILWWKLDASLDLEAVYYSALLPAIAAVKLGVTAFIDHHASANAVDGSLDRIEDALAQVGLRGVLCYETSDRHGKENARAGLRENERYIRKCRQVKAENPDHPFSGMVGLHASFTLDDDTLEQAAALSRTLERGCHIHVLEDPVDDRETRDKYGAGVVDRLQRFGILQEASIAAHCIHLSEAEKDLLAQTGVMVAHNPQSNMNNAVGRTDIFGLLQRGLLLGLGTDGMSPGMAGDVRTALWLHKHDLRDPNAGWNEVQAMLLQNNPEIYLRASGQKVGHVAPGYLADLILVDCFPPTPMTTDNFWGHYLFGIADSVVDTTIINGRIVMRDKVIEGIDEAEIAAKAKEVAKRVWERFYG
ncbi:MAG: putative aminohydrolase SsnA [candidate division KSB1 bacterium]|nr:putative aminohydrolase SsnA [candidate division KSB1 bacterium]